MTAGRQPLNKTFNTKPGSLYSGPVTRTYTARRGNPHIDTYKDMPAAGPSHTQQGEKKGGGGGSATIGPILNEYPIGKYFSHIRHTDLARKAKFRVEISLPVQAAMTQDKEKYMASATAAAQAGQHLNVMCESVTMPGKSIRSVADDLRYGPKREFAQGVAFAEFSAVFQCTSPYNEKQIFQQWHDLIIDESSWHMNYYEDYIGSMKIYAMDRSEQDAYAIEVYEIYPKTIVAQDFGWAQSDAYQTIQVLFTYRNWEPITWESFDRESYSISGAVLNAANYGIEYSRLVTTAPAPTSLQDKQAYMNENNEARTKAADAARIANMKKGDVGTLDSIAAEQEAQRKAQRVTDIYNVNDFSPRAKQNVETSPLTRPEHQLDIIAENRGRFLSASEVPYGTLEDQTTAIALAAQKAKTPAIGNSSGINIDALARAHQAANR